MSKIMKLVDRHRDIKFGYGLEKLRAAIEGEIKQLEVDAVRYRFWRSLFDINSKVDQRLIIEIDRAHTPEELDAAIDSVRSKT